MTALVWFVFALYLNQIIHPTMFPTSHPRKMRTSNLMKIRTRNQTKLQYIYVPYGHVLVTLLVPLRILQFVDLKELVAHYSYKRPFQLVSFVLVLILALS